MAREEREIHELWDDDVDVMDEETEQNREEEDFEDMCRQFYSF